MENSIKHTKETEAKLNKDGEILLTHSPIAKECLNQPDSTEQGCRCGGACKKVGHKHEGKECKHHIQKN